MELLIQSDCRQGNIFLDFKDTEYELFWDFRYCWWNISVGREQARPLVFGDLVRLT